MSTKEELNKFYSKTDPWDYQSNNWDIARRENIIEVLNNHSPFERALDLGCGEGWITEAIPAYELHGYDMSDVALSRLPKNVHPIYNLSDISGKFDLIVATGVLYGHYDYETLLATIKKHASNLILTCNIESWEVPQVKTLGKEILMWTFPYRDYVQKLRLFKVCI